MGKFEKVSKKEKKKTKNFLYDAFLTGPNAKIGGNCPHCGERWVEAFKGFPINVVCKKCGAKGELSLEDRPKPKTD